MMLVGKGIFAHEAWRNADIECLEVHDAPFASVECLFLLYRENRVYRITMR